MIYITGDVHTKNLGNWEQKKAGSEVKNSEKYLKILKKYKLKATLFINGKCLEKEEREVKRLLKYDVELGGHTYNNFGKMGMFKSYINRKRYGCVYGSLNFQKKDIDKTKRCFERFNLKMLSWRTHSYASNDYTFKLLENQGVRAVSDFLGETQPFAKGRIKHFPINTPPDQNTISYGPLTPENRNPFAGCTKGRINSEEWLEIVKKRIRKNEIKKKDSVLLIHPQTMACLDDFKIFERLCKFLSRYQSAKITEFI